MYVFKNLFIFLAALILNTALCANAEDNSKYPEKTITIICTHGTGGDTDYNAQLLSFYLSDKLKVAVEVQNMAGNNGATALNRFAKAEPDGYTLLATNTSALACAEATGISSHSFMDFEPVAVYGKQCGENIVVLASSPYKKLDDLIKSVTKRPNKIKIGVSMGASSFVSSVILSKAKNAHFKMIDVGGDSQGRLNSLLNKYSDVTIVPYALIRDALAEGKVRSLATLMSHRLPDAPKIPTVADAGIPEITFDTLYLLMAPKGTAPEIIEKLNTSIQDVVLHNEDYKAMTVEYNKQDPYALSVKDTIEVLKEQRKHMQTFAQYLN